MVCTTSIKNKNRCCAFTERLKKLDLLTLVYRRARADMTHTTDKHCRTTSSVAKTDQAEFMAIISLKSNLKTGREDYKLTRSTIRLSGHGTTFQEEWSTRVTSTHSSADLTKRGKTSRRNTSSSNLVFS